MTSLATLRTQERAARIAVENTAIALRGTILRRRMVVLFRATLGSVAAVVLAAPIPPLCVLALLAMFVFAIGLIQLATRPSVLHASVYARGSNPAARRRAERAHQQALTWHGNALDRLVTAEYYDWPIGEAPPT